MKSIGSEFFKYVSLNVLGMVGLSCYILADTFFIANGVGADGLTALNLVLPAYSFVSGTGLMFGMGGATLYSVSVGEGNLTRADRIFSLTLWLTAAAGLLFFLVGLLLSAPLAALLGAENEIHGLATIYLKTVLMFSPAFLANNVILAFARNDGSPDFAMAGMLIGSLSNVVLDYLLIFPLGLGMFGAAFATGLAPLISMGILSLHWARKRGRLPQPFSALRSSHVHPEETGRICSIGLPSFITEFSSGIIMLFFNFTILSLAGNTGVAAYGIVANIALIVVAVFTGVAQGIQPLISLNYGLGMRDATKKLFRMSLTLAVILGALVCALGVVFPAAIAAPFNRDGDLLLAAVAEKGIRLYFPAFLIMGVNIVIPAYLAAVTRPRPSFFLALLRGCLAVIPAVLLLPRFLGMAGVWLSIPLAECVTLMVSFLIIWRKPHGEKRQTAGDPR